VVVVAASETEELTPFSGGIPHMNATQPRFLVCQIIDLQIDFCLNTVFSVPLS
jgi:hypothetical protein